LGPLATESPCITDWNIIITLLQYTMG